MKTEAMSRAIHLASAADRIAAAKLPTFYRFNSHRQQLADGELTCSLGVSPGEGSCRCLGL